MGIDSFVWIVEVIIFVFVVAMFLAYFMLRKKVKDGGAK